jgi:AcrR family transcriptional regulator
VNLLFRCVADILLCFRDARNHVPNTKWNTVPIATAGMKKRVIKRADEQQPKGGEPRPMRADARRKMSSLLQSAVEVFAQSGVDAPVREIAERAGVGLGTVYRHFPQRSDLIVAVFQNQMDACANAARVIASKYEPGEALARWMQRYVDFIGTKRGLAAALHSGDPAYSALPGYFDKRLRPALERLLGAAVAAGVVRPGIEADDLLRAVATLCHGAHGKEPAYARKMVELLVDGLRYGAGKRIVTPRKTTRMSPVKSTPTSRLV